VPRHRGRGFDSRFDSPQHQSATPHGRRPLKKAFALISLPILTACGGGGGPDGGSTSPASSTPFSIVSRAAPDDVATTDLLAYLGREFDEQPDDPGALQAADLTFFATLQFSDRVEHIWSFPCAVPTGCWLRVTQRASDSTTGWSIDAPPEA
jgi:hypothetical protein